MRVAGDLGRLVAAGPGVSEGRPALAIAASVILHMTLLAIAVVVRFAAPPAVPLEIPVRVSIVRPADPMAPPGPSPAVLGSPLAKPAPGMIQASTMLSGRALADPRSRKARAALATFADSERVVQLCNLEAMEQVQQWRKALRPDRIVAYARSSETIAGDTIEADGAVFRSGNRWFDLTYRCEVAAGHDKVVAFAFAVGNAVPRALWEDLGLPSGGDLE